MENTDERALSSLYRAVCAEKLMAVQILTCHYIVDIANDCRANMSFPI